MTHLLKTLATLPEDLGSFSSQLPEISSQMPANPISGYLMPSSGHHRYCIQVVQIQAKHKISKILKGKREIM